MVSWLDLIGLFQRLVRQREAELGNDGVECFGVIAHKGVVAYVVEGNDDVPNLRFGQSKAKAGRYLDSLGFHTAPLYEQIPDWCEATLADDSHAVFGCHDLADFFQLCFGHDDSLVFAEGWVVEQEGFEFFANGFSPTAFVRAEAVVLKR